MQAEIEAIDVKIEKAVESEREAMKAEKRKIG
jgi:hypothetical protein